MLTTAGSIHSPKYPDLYPTNVECLWIIRIPAKEVLKGTKFIKLTFLDFNFEFHSSCMYDRLEIYDGEEKNNTLLGSFCGDNLPSPVYASKGQMVVKFVSDEAMTAKGFNITSTFTSLLG